MRRLVILGAVLLAGACSSASSNRPPIGADEVVIDVPRQGTYRFEIDREDQITSAWLPMESGQVWDRLFATYSELGFEARQLATYDPERRQIVVRGERVRSLAGQPLSDFLLCGYSMTSPKADQGQVTVTLISWLVPEGDGTTVNIQFFGRARDRGHSSSVTPCASRGKLEQHMVERIVLMNSGGE